MPSSVFQVEFIPRAGYRSLAQFHGSSVFTVLAWLWALPLAVGWWVFDAGVPVSASGAGAMLGALAILTGLLFAAIPLVISLDSPSALRPLRAVKAQAVSAAVDWLAYCCLVALASLLPTTYLALGLSDATVGWPGGVASALCAALSAHLLVSLVAALALVAAILHRHTRDSEFGVALRTPPLATRPAREQDPAAQPTDV